MKQKHLLILTTIKQIQPTSTIRLARTLGMNISTLRHYLYGDYHKPFAISPLAKYLYTSVKGGLRLNEAGEELVKGYCIYVEDGKLEVGLLTIYDDLQSYC